MKRGIVGNFDSPQRVRRKAWATKLALSANVFLTVSTIFLNKQLFDKFHFPNLTLTLLQLAVTSICMYAVREAGHFTPVRLPWKSVIMFSLGFCTFVSTANLSLQHNTVGTYAMLKMATLVFIPALQCFTHNNLYSLKTILALVPVVVGAVLHICFDRTLNLEGFSLGIVTALATSVYQVRFSEKQKEIQVNSLHLLWYEAPISTLLLIPVVCYFDSPMRLFEREISLEEFGTFVVAGIVATVVHFTTYWIIDNTTATEYNVVSQFKFVCTLLLAYLTFDANSIVPVQLVGDLIALCGIVIYTHLKMVEITHAQYNVRNRIVFETGRV